MFATGVTSGAAPVTEVTVLEVTGHLLSGYSESVVIDYVPSLSTITKADSSTVSVVSPSGVQSSIQTAQIATVLTGTTTIRVTGDSPLIFLTDSRLNGYVSYDIEFDYALESGDAVEIYTYPRFNPNVGLTITDLAYPIDTPNVQLIGNGLVETKDVDYSVVRNAISGFTEDDILTYDILTGTSLVTSFSGYWNRSRIITSGQAGTGYYPTSAQFTETTGATGKILITGITGRTLSTKYDLYLNGQKLISGYHYWLQADSVSGAFGGNAGLTVAYLDPTVLPDWTGEFVTSNGYVTGILSIEDSELTFIPQHESLTRYFKEVTTPFSTYTNLTGFSEQVWVNGVRQTVDVDYRRNYPCSLDSGIVDYPSLPFNFYNNETGYFNIG
jgi:hypothetical protein